MPRRSTRLVAATAVLVALLGACSSESDPADQADRTTVETAATTTAPPRPTPKSYEPDDESFATVPDPIPAGTHGDLLRTQPIEKSPDGLKWYRIMYLSTSLDGAPTVVTGVLTVPDAPTPDGGWDLATHAHGSTGLADDCAPSRTIVSTPSTSAELQVAGKAAADHGFALVSTDYEGQGGPGRHPFLVGRSEGRSVLDATRAARQFPGLDWSDDPIAIVGYSQGGHAALWANQLAGDWTPELTVLGTLAGAPASEVARLLTDSPTPAVDNPQSVGITAGLAAVDPRLDADLAKLLTPAGHRLLEVLDASCTPPAGFTSETPLLNTDPTTIQPWKRLMAANTPGSVVTKDPVLIVHSAVDENVPIAQSAELLARMCAAGQVVERRVLATGTHVLAAVPAYTDGFAWLDGLSKGVKPVDSCATK